MTAYEHLPVKVTLVVEVDGHTLTFEEMGKVNGARYHGADPQHGYSTSDTLESDIRGTVDTCAARAIKRAEAFLCNAYPVCGDDRG